MVVDFGLLFNVDSTSSPGVRLGAETTSF